MIRKTIVTILLLLFVAAGIAYLVLTEIRTGDDIAQTPGLAVEPQSVEADDAETGADHQVIVYYFHGNKRCNTCRTIEEYTEAAINIGFADEVRSGRLEYRTVNVDEPGNEHFVTDYQLSTRTVVLVDIEQGRELTWTKLERVWQLVRDKEAFENYITENTDNFLARHNG